MSEQLELAKLTVQEFAGRFRNEVIPVSNAFSYFSALPMSEEDLKEYLEDPIAALPSAVQGALPHVSVFLVPYLEKVNGKGIEIVTFDKPAGKNQSAAAQFLADSQATLVLAIKDREVADYHYTFYRAVATLMADRLSADADEEFSRLIRDELGNRVHGEVDEEGWQLKQALLRRQTNVRRETKLFRAYVRQALIDTLTLYLHGICCDIDVETGPRQLPSRFLRRRLELLQQQFPPPAGYAVFPEDANRG